MEDSIAAFVLSLAKRPHTENSFNPYRDPSHRVNLMQYLGLTLAQPGRRILLVGEALGYRGGRLTGIPFSSERLLLRPSHPFPRSLSQNVEIKGATSEATATLVWNALAGRRRIPLFWNAFPFHPHLPRDPWSNRAPTRSEIDEGAHYLASLAELQQPERIAGLGKKGCLAARRALPGRVITPLRHPSYGGKIEFLEGLAKFLRG